MHDKNNIFSRTAKFAISLATVMTCFSINPTYAEETPTPSETPTATEATEQIHGNQHGQNILLNKEGRKE